MVEWCLATALALLRLVALVLRGLGWLVPFVLRKNGEKRGVSAAGLFCAGGQASRMASASGQTYVRQALAPTLHPLWVGGRDCFSRHHVLLFAVSALLNLFDDRSSTPVPWC